MSVNHGFKSASDGVMSDVHYLSLKWLAKREVLDYANINFIKRKWFYERNSRK